MNNKQSIENITWDKPNEKELRIHKIHAYPAKFPSFLTTKAIDYAEAKGIEVQSIADIFCGCGTVAVEARRLNIDFYGYDINPVAVLIAKTKSENYEINNYLEYINNIIVMYDSDKSHYRNDIERIHYWFDDITISNLAKLKHSIFQLISEDQKYLDLFLCIFSSILKNCSRWLTKSIKPQIDPKKKPADVKTAFIEHCKKVEKAINEVTFYNKPTIKIYLKNSLDIKEQNKVDMILTSPPYVTSYEYADLHQLSTLWLGYIADYRDLRENTIGSVYGNIDNDIDVKNLNSIGFEIVSQLENVDKKKARDVTKYYADMQEAACVSYNLLKDGGIVFFIIGNTSYKGVIVNNAEHLKLAMKESGFSNIEKYKRKISQKILTPYRDKKGRFSREAKNKVYHEEFILIGRKGYEPWNKRN